MKSLQIVCINYGKLMDAVKVVSHCLNVFPRFERATIIYRFGESQKSELKKVNNIEIIPAKSKTQNECWFHEMHRYITCDHALTVQWDGFIIRPDLWTDEFLEYDIIAPPWPLQNIVNPSHRVGSGGFLLFSKAICQMWGEINDPHPAYSDWQVGAVKRSQFESRGMRYAPIELAARFGKEHDLEDMKIKEGSTFGFHDFRINPEYREKYRKMLYG